MPAPVFIGDELTAAGYRLAGARTLTPAPDAVEATLAELRPTADLVFLASAYAARIDPEQLAAWMRAGAPLLLTVPGATDADPPPDMGAEVDRVLGIGR